MRSLHVSQVVHRPPREVYDYARDPDHLPLWASGLARSEVTRDGDALLVDSPMGRISVRFAPRNEYGVLDHDVELPTGTTVVNPFRVLAHPDGAELLFSIRQLELSDDELARDAEVVQADLRRLKELLESPPAEDG